MSGQSFLPALNRVRQCLCIAASNQDQNWNFELCHYQSSLGFSHSCPIPSRAYLTEEIANLPGSVASVPELLENRDHPRRFFSLVPPLMGPLFPSLQKYRKQIPRGCTHHHDTCDPRIISRDWGYCHSSHTVAK